MSSRIEGCCWSCFLIISRIGPLGVVCSFFICYSPSILQFYVTLVNKRSSPIRQEESYLFIKRPLTFPVLLSSHTSVKYSYHDPSVSRALGFSSFLYKIPSLETLLFLKSVILPLCQGMGHRNVTFIHLLVQSEL